MITPRKLKLLYDKGENISLYLRKKANVSQNTPQIIEATYDLQAGRDSRDLAQVPGLAAFQAEYSKEVARTILSLCEPKTVLEAGAGEARTLSKVVESLDRPEADVYGFDLSWSRVALGKKRLEAQKLRNVRLCTGNLLHLPFMENSIDVVYTSHAIEPNGGNEEPILRELYTAARNYLILVEPAYEFVSEKGRQRMEKHGYCKNLAGIAISLGYKVIEHKVFPVIFEPLNPSALIIIEKKSSGKRPSSVYACPKYKKSLKEIGGMYYSPEGLCVYPVVGGIPCLRIENAITASKFPEMMMDN